MKILGLIFSLFTLSCAGPAPKGEDIGTRLSQSDYLATLKASTREEKKYDGFYQLYEAHVILLDSNVQSAILQRKSDVYRWNAEIAQREREKMFQENSNSTTFVMSFFAPRNRIVDFHKKSTSIWKVFLEANGQRYESDIKKIQGPYENTAAIFPIHNRFTTAYEIKFQVPLSAIEKMNPKLTITSAIGTTELQF